MKRHLDNSANSSCSSLGSNNGAAGVCRICHVVESKERKRPVRAKDTRKFEPNSMLFRWIFGGNCRDNQDDGDDELIAPCECKGTMRYVHRGCLNQWRTASPRSDSFTRCEQCFASYTFKDTWMTSILMHRVCIYSLCGILFVAWVAASTFVSTGAFYNRFNLDSATDDSSMLFNLLPLIYFDSKMLNPLISLCPSLTPFVFLYNDFMTKFNGLFYGLIFVALTEYIFFTPSFILSFNTLFCIWRIQRYEIFFDKWLLVAFTGFGLWRAGKSLHEMIEAALMRIVKLKLLEVKNRDE